MGPSHSSVFGVVGSLPVSAAGRSDWPARLNSECLLITLVLGPLGHLIASLSLSETGTLCKLCSCIRPFVTCIRPFVFWDSRATFSPNFVMDVVRGFGFDMNSVFT